MNLLVCPLVYACSVKTVGPRSSIFGMEVGLDGSVLIFYIFTPPSRILHHVRVFPRDSLRCDVISAYQISSEIVFKIKGYLRILDVSCYAPLMENVPLHVCINNFVAKSSHITESIHFRMATGKGRSSVGRGFESWQGQQSELSFTLPTTLINSSPRRDRVRQLAP